MSKINVFQNLHTQYPFGRKMTQIHIKSCTADKLCVNVDYFMAFYQFLRISQKFCHSPTSFTLKFWDGVVHEMY